MEENIYTTTDYENDMRITALSKANLASVSKWAKFLSVIGFIMIGISVVLLLICGSAVSASGMAPMGYPYGMGAFGWPYIIICIIILLIYFLPMYYLYSFSVKCKTALLNNDSSILSDSFGWLNRYYTFIGILTIIGLVLYLFIIISAVIMMTAMM